MVHLIDKDRILAEIERRMDFHHKRGNQHDSCVEDVLYGILSYINTLEAKEVDLEKHLKEDIDDVLFDLNGVAVKGATHYLTVEDVKDIAKHFYSLGMAASKLE